MKGSRFNEEQIIGIPPEQEAGAKTTAQTSARKPWPAADRSSSSSSLRSP